MAQPMTPIEHAFVAAVVRYAALCHGGAPAHRDEKARLATLLSTSDADGRRGFERRRHRRLVTSIAAVTKLADRQAPARVVDISGGGLRLRNDGRMPLRPGDRAVVSLVPDASPMRIDIPCEVVAQTDADHVGLRFCGAPLVMHRPALGRTTARQHGTAEVFAMGTLGKRRAA